MVAETNLERALQAVKRIGSFSEAEKDALQKAFRTALFPGNWSMATPNDNDVLLYDAATETWSPEALPGGTFVSLSDTPANYSGAGSRFVKVNSGATALEFATAAINDLSDVSGSPSSGHYLKYTGAGWEPAVAPVVSVNGDTGTVVLDIDDVTPTTTKGDIIVENGSNAVRLAIGTNGHVLTANSAVANGLEWAAPVTGFADPMTTRGDIIYRNSSNTTARLPAGTANYVLTSDGTDIAWAASVAGVNVFTGLSDVPASYVGQANKYVKVNAAATALEFTSATPVTSVTASSPMASSGGTTPNLTIQAATAAQHGYMTSTYAAKLDGIEAGADVTDATNVAAAGAFMGNITISASAPSGGADGDIWFQVV